MIIYIFCLVNCLEYSITNQYTTKQLSNGKQVQVLNNQYLCLYSLYHQVQRRYYRSHAYSLSGYYHTQNQFMGWKIYQMGQPLKLHITDIQPTTKCLVFESPPRQNQPNFMAYRKISGQKSLYIQQYKDYGTYLQTNSLNNFKNDPIYIGPVCKSLKSGPHISDEVTPVQLNIYQCTVHLSDASNEYQMANRVHSKQCKLSASKPTLPYYIHNQLLICLITVLLINSIIL